MRPNSAWEDTLVGYVLQNWRPRSPDGSVSGATAFVFFEKLLPLRRVPCLDKKIWLV